jgi:di/tricarboxylate transporter
MTFEIALLLALIVAAVFFFAFEWFPPDVVALSVLLILVFTGLLPAKEAFAGFGSDTVMLILGLLLLTAALLRTGVMDLAAGPILRYTGKSENRLLLVLMVASAGLGAFMSNTASTAFFLPVVLGIARRLKLNPGRLLLPLAFSSILSSSVTLISTSTNIVVSGLMTRYGLEPMGMFELAPVGIPIVICGLLYMFFIGRRLLPARTPHVDETDAFGIRPYLTEILILPKSYLVGKTLAESGLGHDLDLTVLRVIRDKTQHVAARPDLKLQANDVLLVEGLPDEIVKIKDKAGIEIKADVKLSDPSVQDDDVGLVEAIVQPRSPLVGSTLKRYRFRERYGLQVLGINRHGENLHRKISQVLLRMGDMLLLQGPKPNLVALEDTNAFRIIGHVGGSRPNRKKAPLAIAIFLGVLLLATLNVMPLPVAILLGCVLTFFTRCITPDEAYREVEWKAIILIGSMLALGAAMDKTGAAKYLASLIVDWAGLENPLLLLSGFFVLTVLLTQPMSNQAAAVVVLPVAFQTAVQLGLNPRTFAMMIAVAASCSYLTPLEPACLMVYGPGRYRFRDFLKVGSLLTLIIFVLAILLVPRVWPLNDPGAKAAIDQGSVPGR